jgi:hypothetical protein
MPTFEIPDGPTTVALERSGDAKNPGPATGSVVFSVTNKSEATRDAGLTVIPTDKSLQQWFAIDGDQERTFASGETQTVTVRVSAPKDAAAGSYPFKLRAVAVGDPDNDFAEGPVSTAKVPPPPPLPNGGPKWWLWILIGVVVLVVIAAVIYFAFLRNSGSSEQTTTNTTDATPLTPASRMGALEMGFDRPGLDIRAGQTVPNVQACVKQCEDTQQCVALTYVFIAPGNTQNGVCWIKSGIPHQVPNPYMISAVKVPG